MKLYSTNNFTLGDFCFVLFYTGIPAASTMTVNGSLKPQQKHVNSLDFI